MKRFLLLLTVFCVLLTGCTGQQREPEKKQYTATFLTLFVVPIFYMILFSAKIPAEN